MENVCGIYRIVCSKNGNYYYGSAASIWKRWQYHRRDLRKNRHINPRMQHTWNKYGEDSFRCELTEIVAPDILRRVEDTYLAKHVGKPHCMNIKKSSSEYSKHTGTTKEKIRAAVLEWYQANPHIKKLRSETTAKQWQTQDKVAIGNLISKNTTIAMTKIKADDPEKWSRIVTTAVKNRLDANHMRRGKPGHKWTDAERARQSKRMKEIKVRSKKVPA